MSQQVTSPNGSMFFSFMFFFKKCSKFFKFDRDNKETRGESEGDIMQQKSPARTEPEPFSLSQEGRLQTLGHRVPKGKHIYQKIIIKIQHIWLIYQIES